MTRFSASRIHGPALAALSSSLIDGESTIPLERMRPRTILLFCDYFADPVWTYPKRAMLRVDGLPLSDMTKDALKQWAARYDELRKTGFEWPRLDDAEQFEHEGRRLWRTVQEELGPAWKVGYLSASENRVLW